MQSARLKVAELELKLTELTKHDVHLRPKNGNESMGHGELKENVIPLVSKSTVRKGMPPRPSAELKKLASENKELREQITDLRKANELLKSALSDLQAKNEAFCSKLSLLTEGRHDYSSPNGKSDAAGNDELKSESFGALSSIKDEAIAEFMSNE
eukprot:TRINITY_DN17964_c0_g1_i2.p1 TRINITY_DN17964_c0_g1~~TRINITY_DN17964_c0_g1_i2.p1  ORF type:complete len:155 (+),score=23.33 TRINITY_DN17964_c0_g1_i2:114-578(+)